MHPLLKDPFVAGEIDAALEEHKDALTPRQIEAFREKLAWTFANNPAAQLVLERSRAAHAKSGTRVKDGFEAPEEDDEAKTAKGAG